MICGGGGEGAGRGLSDAVDDVWRGFEDIRPHLNTSPLPVIQTDPAARECVLVGMNFRAPTHILRVRQGRYVRVGLSARTCVRACVRACEAPSRLVPLPLLPSLSRGSEGRAYIVQQVHQRILAAETGDAERPAMRGNELYCATQNAALRCISASTQPRPSVLRPLLRTSSARVRFGASLHRRKRKFRCRVGRGEPRSRRRCDRGGEG